MNEFGSTKNISDNVCSTDKLATVAHLIDNTVGKRHSNALEQRPAAPGSAAAQMWQ